MVLDPKLVPHVDHGLPRAGTTAQRPAGAVIGFMYYDTDVNEVMVYNGSAWVACTGLVTNYAAAGLHTMRVAKFIYDFSVDGAGSGGHPRTITPASSPTFPIGALIMDGIMEVITPPTGATNLSVGTQAAGDIIADAAISGAPWSTAGRKLIVPVNSVATIVKIATTAKQVSIISTVAALTAGKFNIFLRYVQSD